MSQPEWKLSLYFRHRYVTKRVNSIQVNFIYILFVGVLDKGWAYYGPQATSGPFAFFIQHARDWYKIVYINLLL